MRRFYQENYVQNIYKLCKNKQIEYENTNKEISDFISYYYKSVINSGKKNEI